MTWKVTLSPGLCWASELARASKSFTCLSPILTMTSPDFIPAFAAGLFAGASRTMTPGCWASGGVGSTMMPRDALEECFSGGSSAARTHQADMARQHINTANGARRRAFTTDLLSTDEKG